MKKQLLLIILLTSYFGFSQDVLMQNGTFIRCQPSIFYDSGGEFDGYNSNENFIITFCPESDGDKLSLNFISFATQLNQDIMTIYDGDNISSPLLETFSGVQGLGLTRASEDNLSGCLTIQFISNASGITTGWAAEILCDNPCQTITPSIDSTSPVANEFGLVTIQAGDTVEFNGSALFSDDNTNATFSWNFGDGNSINGMNVVHTFSEAGNFNVILTVSDDDPAGCFEIDSIVVSVTGENVIVDQSIFTIEELIEDVLIGVECSQVFNISYSTGNNFGEEEPNGIGYFVNGNTNFPFTEGLILSTGNAIDANGPNDFNTTSSGTNSWLGDADLEVATGIQQSFNATVIEFDFISVVDEISFDFLMASEEYDQGTFECNFSDAFAFLLTDSQGVTTNLAVLPGTETPILVTNIHPENSSCPAINEEYFGGYVPINSPPIEYDGRTTVFTAQSAVNIGESYHIKLVIADAADSSIDSAVFLKARSFDIGELCNDVGIINVKAFNDANMDGDLDANETDFTYGYFTYEKNNDGIVNTINTSSGNFSIVSTDENDTYSISFNVYDDYVDCYNPSSTIVDTISVENGTVTTVDFPINDALLCEDLAIYLINPFAPPRPGFSYENFIVLENLSSFDIDSGTIEFSHDDLLEFNFVFNLNPNYVMTPTDTGFTIDFVNLEAGASDIIEVSLSCPVTVDLGELVTNTATYLTDSTDLVINNNTSELSEIVVGSFDPNDKMESHGRDIFYDDFTTSDEYLYYTIRFQNLGTAPAEFIRIDDVLSNQLDETTFQMLRSSHDYVVTRTENNLEWFFEDINLPAEQDDAEGSQGYVYFKIKPQSGYAIGDIIENTASIVFDFNAPIITNTFETEFIEENLSVTEIGFNLFDIFPNPATDVVTIRLNANNFGNVTVKIIDLQGKLILEQHISEGHTTELDIADLQSGLYFVKLNTNNNNLVKKLIIE